MKIFITDATSVLGSTNKFRVYLCVLSQLAIAAHCYHTFDPSSYKETVTWNYLSKQMKVTLGSPGF